MRICGIQKKLSLFLPALPHTGEHFCAAFCNCQRKSRTITEKHCVNMFTYTVIPMDLENWPKSAISSLPILLRYGGNSWNYVKVWKRKGKLTFFLSLLYFPTTWFSPSNFFEHMIFSFKLWIYYVEISWTHFLLEVVLCNSKIMDFTFTSFSEWSEDFL